jgi:hypothetical protein
MTESVVDMYLAIGWQGLEYGPERYISEKEDDKHD